MNATIIGSVAFSAFAVSHRRTVRIEVVNECTFATIGAYSLAPMS
ncbi:hypothetical protein [uncultured Duncaniella sp.]|nr:hypothetical protein [uncultured Duncaniella sp.]